MEKKSFLLYFDSYTWLSPLTYEEKGTVLDALFLYGLQLQQRDLRPGDYLKETGLWMSESARVVFGFMADSIYRDTMKWKRTVERKMGKKAESARAVKDKPPQDSMLRAIDAMLMMKKALPAGDEGVASVMEGR